MYIVIKTIKGKQYRYLQRSYRVGTRVRTESQYLGPLGGVRRMVKRVTGFVQAQGPLFSKYDEEEALRQNCARESETEKARLASLDRLHEQYGLRLADEKDLGRPGAPVEHSVQTEAAADALANGDNCPDKDATVSDETGPDASGSAP